VEQQYAVAGSIQANRDLTGDFTRANQLYEQGHYAEAATAHEQIPSRRFESPALWFNLGNARLKPAGRAPILPTVGPAPGPTRSPTSRPIPVRPPTGRLRAPAGARASPSAGCND